MKIKLLSVKKSSNPKKKLTATFLVDDKEKSIDFGSASNKDFTIYSKEDKAKLAEVLEVPYGAQGRLPNTAIAAALRDEGFDIGDAAVTKHRRGGCRCFGSNPKVAM